MRPLPCAPAQNIFKANWLAKHHNEVPSVVVLVFAVNSACTSVQWADVEARVNDAVVGIRPSMLGRSNDLHVLMVQQRQYPRAKEDRDTLELMGARVQSYVLVIVVVVVAAVAVVVVGGGGGVVVAGGGVLLLGHWVLLSPGLGAVMVVVVVVFCQFL